MEVGPHRAILWLLDSVGRFGNNRSGCRNVFEVGEFVAQKSPHQHDNGGVDVYRTRTGNCGCPADAFGRAGGIVEVDGSGRTAVRFSHPGLKSLVGVMDPL